MKKFYESCDFVAVRNLKIVTIRKFIKNQT